MVVVVLTIAMFTLRFFFNWLQLEKHTVFSPLISHNIFRAPRAAEKTPKLVMVEWLVLIQVHQDCCFSGKNGTNKTLLSIGIVLG